MSDEMIECCPYCKHPKIASRVGNGQFGPAIEKRNYCTNCKKRFDEPDTRPSKNTPRSAASVLRAIGVDPDEAME